MSDLISRAAVLSLPRAYAKNARGKIFKEFINVKDIEALQSAQPERRMGKWIKKMRVTETEKYISYDPDWYCACCGAKYDPHTAKFVNFCYVCGADMRGEQDDSV